VYRKIASHILRWNDLLNSYQELIQQTRRKEEEEEEEKEEEEIYLAQKHQ